MLIFWFKILLWVTARICFHALLLNTSQVHYFKLCFTAGVSETPKSDARQTRLYAILIKLGKVRNLKVIKQCCVCVLRC